MKRANRILLTGICAIICLLGAAHWFHLKPVHAQQQAGYYDDGTFYIYASIDVDSNYNLTTDSYMEVEFDDYEDIDEIEVDGYADQDGGLLISGSSDGDDYDPAEVEFYSKAPVAPGHEYGIESDGYACFDDGEGDCDGEYVGTAYASVNVASPTPQISSISPSNVNEGDQGTLTMSGSNLVVGSGDQLTINYSGSGMPFTLTGTPSSSTASFSYDFTGYSPGTYTLSVTNNEGTSNSKTFTVNPPLNACSQSTVPNSVTLQIAGLGSGNGNQSGTFTVSLPIAASNNAAATVSYGPFSTPSSVASNIASVITRNYAIIGVTAQSDGPNITLQSRTAFGSLSSSSSGSIFGINIGVPSSVSCIALPTLPSLPCTGLVPNYDVSRTYSDGVTETARQHILRKHIVGTPTQVPPNTIYTGTNGPSSVFTLVQLYNFTTVLLNPLPQNGAYIHTFSKKTISGPNGTVDYGWIGTDASGNDLYTNKLYLTKDRCTVNTSFPVQ